MYTHAKDKQVGASDIHDNDKQEPAFRPSMSSKLYTETYMTSTTETLVASA